MKEGRLKNLGEKLKELRKSKNLSLKEVGLNIGISHNFLSEIENGKKEPSKETLRELAKFYGIDEDEFFDIIDKVPLRASEFLENDPELQRLLSEAQRKFSHNPKKLEVMKKRILKIYEDFLED